MSYMEQQMQNYLEAGISEVNRCYTRIAELEEQNADLVTERDALAACISDVCALFTRIAESEEVVINSNIKHIIDSELMYDISDFVEHKTPQQCLSEICAEAGRAGFVAGMNYCINFLDSNYPTLGIEDCANDYVAELQQGGAE